MKDFSLFYGPLRRLLPVVAMAVLALVVLVIQVSGAQPACDPVDATCAEPLPGQRQLLGNQGGLDRSPTGISTENADEAEPSPWDDVDPSAGEVPFVSLRPSPEPMTEAGEELVRSAGPVRE